MIYPKCSYRCVAQRYRSAFSVVQANINLHISQTTEIQVDDDEALIINSLRGLNGKKAKLRAFKLFIDIGSYTFDELVETFPNYID